MATFSPKPLPTIGVDKFTYFPLVTELTTGSVYSQGTTLPGTVSVEITDTAGTANFDADNVAYESAAYTENGGFTLTNASIPPDVAAEWRGMPRMAGAYVQRGVSRDAYFGVAWRVLISSGKHLYYKSFKGKFAFADAVGATTKPSSGAPTFKTSTATYSRLSRADEMQFAYIMEDNIEPLLGISVAEFEEKWFTDGNYCPPIITDVTVAIAPTTFSGAAGAIETFTATVTGTVDDVGGAGVAAMPQAVNWSVSPAQTDGTTITSAGVLTIGTGAARTFDVIAESAVDRLATATAVVTVT